MQKPNFISRDDLAQWLGVTPRTLRNWEMRGYGPQPLRLCRTIYYRPGDVDDFLNAGHGFKSANDYTR